jgi:hypothetical protein
MDTFCLAALEVAGGSGGSKYAHEKCEEKLLKPRYQGITMDVIPDGPHGGGPSRNPAVPLNMYTLYSARE